jgi:RNA polymerase sigma factor (sigma-70 family)
VPDLTDLSDLELVDATRAGDREAFAELWRRHARAGLTVARAHSDLDADDLVAEAYAKIYQAIANGNGPTSGFRAYLFTTVRSVAATWGRRSRETPIDDADTIEDPAFTEAAGLDALDRSLTASAFRTLPTRWQEVLWYCEVERMKPAEVAPLLGMSANGVAALAYRAREGLRQAWIQAHLASVPEGSDCRWTTERLGAYARHGLGKRDTAKVEAHLIDCARCTVVAAEAKDVGSRIALVLLPLIAGVGGATAYSAWMQSGAHTVPYAAGTAGAAIPAAATGGAGAGAVGAGAGANAGAGAAGSGSASGGSSTGLGVGAVTSFAIGGVLVAAAVAGAFVLGPSLFTPSPAPTSAAVAEPAAPAAPAPATSAAPAVPAPAAPAPTIPAPGAPADPADPVTVDAPTVSAPTAPAATVPGQPTTPSTPDVPPAPRPASPVLSDAFPADGYATNAERLDAAGTGAPGAVITAVAAPATAGGAGARTAVAATAVPLASVTVGADGAWRIALDLSALADGSWAISFAQTTATGTSDPVSRTLIVDRTALPPQIVAVDTGSGPTAGYAAPIVSGVAEPGATVEVSDGSLLLATVTAGADGSWTTPELVRASRTFALTARQTDALGNISAPSAASTGTLLAPSITATSILMDITMTAYGLPSTRLLLYVDGVPTGQSIDTAPDGTASAAYVWVGAPAVPRIGFGYDFGGRHGIVADAPVTLPGAP